MAIIKTIGRKKGSSLTNREILVEILRRFEADVDSSKVPPEELDRFVEDIRAITTLTEHMVPEKVIDSFLSDIAAEFRNYLTKKFADDTWGSRPSTLTRSVSMPQK